jgi:LysR family transcriptional activator of nhaA
MSFLNYHHLRYFRAIANEGSLTRAAERLNLSQSALSTQLRSLEENLGQPLFLRQNKSLVLTEAGRIALDYAQSIFRSGEELVDVLQNRSSGRRHVLRVGAVATLSRNFQLSLLRPLLGRSDLELIIRSGNLRDLLAQLRAHTLDVVLSTLPVRRDAETDWHSHLLDEQPVSLIGLRSRKRTRFSFPEDLRTTPLLLPSLDSNIRVAFDLMLEQFGIRPIIAGEVDDMAMLRLLAREGAGLALVPPVVVRGELDSGLLVERHRIEQIRESFYAITPSRRFPNSLLRDLLRREPLPSKARGVARQNAAVKRSRKS